MSLISTLYRFDGAFSDSMCHVSGFQNPTVKSCKLVSRWQIPSREQFLGLLIISQVPGVTDRPVEPNFPSKALVPSR